MLVLIVYIRGVKLGEIKPSIMSLFLGGSKRALETHRLGDTAAASCLS